VGRTLEAVGVPPVGRDMSHCHAKANDELEKKHKDTLKLGSFKGERKKFTDKHSVIE
jgi:hypothetical protein